MRKMGVHIQPSKRVARVFKRPSRRMFHELSHWSARKIIISLLRHAKLPELLRQSRSLLLRICKLVPSPNLVTTIGTTSQTIPSVSWVDSSQRELSCSTRWRCPKSKRGSWMRSVDCSRLLWQSTLKSLASATTLAAKSISHPFAKPKTSQCTRSASWTWSIRSIWVIML